MITGQTKDRKGPDGLTKERRRNLYDPRLYVVARVPGEASEFLAMNTNGAEFKVLRTGRRRFMVTSNTGGIYKVGRQLAPGQFCGCKDAEGRASAEGRLCKHTAASAAVVLFLRAEEAAEAAMLAQAAESARRLQQVVEWEERRAQERAEEQAAVIAAFARNGKQGRSTTMSPLWLEEVAAQAAVIAARAA